MTLYFPSDIAPLRKSFNVQTVYRTKKSRLGEGYRQVRDAGINPTDTKVDLEFLVDQSKFTTLMGFFDLVKGSTPFIWTLPGFQASYWIVSGTVSWTPERDDLFRVRTTWESFNQLVQPSTALTVESTTAIRLN